MNSKESMRFGSKIKQNKAKDYNIMSKKWDVRRKDKRQKSKYT